MIRLDTAASGTGATKRTLTYVPPDNGAAAMSG